MLDLMEFLRNSFFSGAFCCGLGILRGTKIKILPTIYFCGFVCASIFYVLNSFSLPFLGSFMAAATVSVLVCMRGYNKNHLLIIIPSIYCISPGGAMYKMFFALFNLDWTTFCWQFAYIIKVAVGCRSAITIVTVIRDKILKNNA